MSDLDPDAALALVQSARNSVAERVRRAGWVFDLGYAALIGAVVSSWAWPVPFDVMVFGFSAAGLSLLVYLWSRRTGLSLRGVSYRRARWASIVIAIAVSIAMMAIAYLTKHGMAWAAAPIGIGAAIAAFIVSWRWRQMWLEEIGAQW